MYFQSYAVRSLERMWSFWMLVMLAAYVTLVTNGLVTNQSGAGRDDYATMSASAVLVTESRLTSTETASG